MNTTTNTGCPIKVDIHEPSFPCSYWRPCCCGRQTDGHCWGCGCEMSAHPDGDHPRFAEKFATALGEAISDSGSGYDEGYSNGK